MSKQKLLYKKEFQMVDGSPTYFTTGKEYPVVSAFKDEDGNVVQVENDEGAPHFFLVDVKEGEFNMHEHFDTIEEVSEAA